MCANMPAYQVRVANSSDMPSWLLLAKEVEPLFGPMLNVPEFQNALIDAIDSQRALCAVPGFSNQSGNIVGGIVISCDTNSIDWFAVSMDFRNCGIGRDLLCAAIGQLDVQRPIRVQTFAPQSPDGAAARKLYLAFGFEDKEAKEPTASGIPTVLMERPPCSDCG